MFDLASWSGLLAFAATTGIITAVLNQVFGISRDWLAARATRRSQAAYLALRLASLLEAYAYACASFIGENANAPQHPDEPFPSWQTKLPKLTDFPEETGGWHSIDLRLAGRALDLRNRIAGSQGVIDATAEFAEDDLEQELEEHAGARGHEAWQLAMDLRSRYSLPAFAPVWDFTETLESARQRAKKAKADRAAGHAALLEELAADQARHGQ